MNEHKHEDLLALLSGGPIEGVRAAGRVLAEEFGMARAWSPSALDLTVSVALLLVLFAGFVAYSVRVSWLGPMTFARVEAAGTSPLLGKQPMQMAYWLLTPAGRFLSARGVTPNAITTSSLVLGALAGVAAAMGHFGVACGLSAVSAFGDALDGMVARETRATSRGGALFDAAVDRYNEFFFLAGLGLFYHHSKLLLAAVLLSILGSFLVSYASAKADALGVHAPRGAMRRAERAAYLTAGAGLVPVFGLLARSFDWPLPGDAPLVLAVVLVAVVANVSAVRRLARIAKLADEAPEAPSETALEPRPWPAASSYMTTTFAKHQIASAITTVVDFGGMMLFVEFADLNPALATLLGASAGAVVNFVLNRRWTFQPGPDGGVGGQALRYSVVSGASAVLNALGVHVVAGLLGVPYVLGRAGVSAFVSLAWNYPMQRTFVFAHRNT